MKKLVSVLLCLCMVFSLLPLTAQAEGLEATLPEGHQQLYAWGETRTSNNALGGRGLQFSLSQNGEFVTGADYTASCSDGLGTVSYVEVEGEQLWDWNCRDTIPGTTGYLTLTSKTNPDAKYSVYAVVGRADVGIYTTPTIEEDPGVGYVRPDESGCFTVVSTGEDAVTTLYAIPGYDYVSILADGIICDNDNISVVRLDSGVLKIALSNPAESSAAEATIAFQVQWGDGEEKQTAQQEIRVSFVDLISPAHPTKADDIFTVTDVGTDLPWFHSESAAVPFELDGATYYFNVGEINRTYPGSGAGCSNSLAEDQTIWFTYDIGFFVSLGNGDFNRVTDSETLQKILSAFGDSLQIKIQALECSELGIEAPAVFPAVHRTQPGAAGCEGIGMEVGIENRGWYLVTATGTVNGKELSVQCTLNWDPAVLAVFSPSPDRDPVQQVNDFLDEFDVQPNTNIEISMPAGSYEGYIVIPKDFGRDVVVDIIGSWEETGTTLTGGIEIQGGLATGITNIHFQGAVKENGTPAEKWQNGVNQGRNNYAIYGTSWGVASHCTFTGYDVAMHSASTTAKYGEYNDFIQNGTAILFDGELTGNLRLTGNYFAGNTTAIAIDSLPEGQSFTMLQISKNAFVDNETDIRNSTKRNFFIPGCYFGTTENGGLEARECRYLPKAAGNADKKVHYYPQAETTDFTSYLYDVNFYESAPVLSTFYTAQYPIPASELDGATFTIHDAGGETELATISYAAAAQTYARMRTFALEAGEEETFDATVQVVRSDDGSRIDVTLQEIPGGRTPTVSVPCDESWAEAAVVDEDENEYEAVVEGGYIRFMVDAGGTYTITRTTEAYTVTFDSNGGSRVEAQTVTAGACAEEPAAPSRAGYRFTGWYLDGSLYDFETAITGDITLTAGWERNAVTVTPPASSTSDASDASDTGKTVELPFRDVDRTDWYYDAVQYVCGHGLMNGTGNEKFSPQDSTTRGMIVTILYRLSCSPAVRSDGASWWSDARVWAMDNGISDGTNMDGTITREQLAAMLFRYAKLTGADPSARGDLSSFTDAAQVSSWAVEAMEWACGAGLIHGSNGALMPQADATRAQVAAILSRFCESVK